MKSVANIVNRKLDRTTVLIQRLIWFQSRRFVTVVGVPLPWRLVAGNGISIKTSVLFFWTTVYCRSMRANAILLVSVFCQRLDVTVNQSVFGGFRFLFTCVCVHTDLRRGHVFPLGNPPANWEPGKFTYNTVQFTWLKKTCGHSVNEIEVYA